MQHRKARLYSSIVRPLWQVLKRRRIADFYREGVPERAFSYLVATSDASTRGGTHRRPSPEARNGQANTCSVKVIPDRIAKAGTMHPLPQPLPEHPEANLDSGRFPNWTKSRSSVGNSLDSDSLSPTLYGKYSGSDFRNPPGISGSSSHHPYQNC